MTKQEKIELKAKRIKWLADQKKELELKHYMRLWGEERPGPGRTTEQYDFQRTILQSMRDVGLLSKTTAFSDNFMWVHGWIVKAMEDKN